MCDVLGRRSVTGMRFADELRGSEGERCMVTDLSTGKRHAGTVEQWNDVTQKARVRYDDGTLVSVGYTFVTLTEPEPA